MRGLRNLATVLGVKGAVARLAHRWAYGAPRMLRT